LPARLSFALTAPIRLPFSSPLASSNHMRVGERIVLPGREELDRSPLKAAILFALTRIACSALQRKRPQPSRITLASSPAATSSCWVTDTIPFFDRHFYYGPEPAENDGALALAKRRCDCWLPMTSE